jgi:transposase
MFVRKKKNASGSVSVQIVDKSRGYRVFKTLGAASDPEEISRLVELGRQWLIRSRRQYSLFPKDQQSNAVLLDFVQTLENAAIRTLGPELVLGRLFDEIGFSVIPESLFRDMVVARLAYPTSKLKTVDYLYRYQGKTVSPASLYRFLDRLNERHAEKVQAAAYHHSRKVLRGIRVIFYDVTTLYFEAESEDDLRRMGFSKDGKFQCPQIVLGLLVGKSGHPIGYDIFEGNTFEGKTLLPVLERIQERYRLGRPTLVADAAMLSKENIGVLQNQGYPFIIAARLRNETRAAREEILQRSAALQNGQSLVLERSPFRLVISYPDKRARKDARNRERGLRRLQREVRSGRLTKEHLNHRGYNKFLKLSGEAKVEIDEEGVKQEARWDGLKGYLTNTELSPDEVIENYGQLWQIEKAFRISKTDLRIRPMYHRRRRRIEAHVLVAFAAYAIYKELERRLEDAQLEMSAQRAIELTQTMYEISFHLPNDPIQQRILLKMDPEQQKVYDLLYPH